MSQSLSSLCRGVFPDTSTSSPSTSSAGSSSKSSIVSKVPVAIRLFYSTTSANGPLSTPRRGCQCRGPERYRKNPDQRRFALADPEALKPFAIGRMRMAVSRYKRIRPRGWFLNLNRLPHTPNSRRISSCGIPGDGWARAASMRANISGSTGCSSCAIRNSRYRAAGVTSDSGRRLTSSCSCPFAHRAAAPPL
jgi:hypothetical protein